MNNTSENFRQTLYEVLSFYKSKKSKNILEQKAKEAISLIKPNSIYFAHLVDIGKIKEEEFIEVISQKFSGLNIYNPNKISNEENYQL